jgi:hypothetical protein
MSKSNGKPVSAVVQRDSLLKRKRERYAAYADHTAKRQQAERGMNELGKRLRAAYTRGGEDTDELESAHEMAQADYDRHLAQANAALDDTKAAEADLHYLYKTCFEELAVEAEKVSGMAEVACTDFLTAFHRAVTCWDAAREAWRPLCQGVGIDNMGVFPVTEFQLSEIVNGEAVARPPQAEQLLPLDGMDSEVLTD